MSDYVHLTREQRYTIEVLKKRGETQSSIARAICVHASTVCREIKRNSNSSGGYTAKGAQDFSRLAKVNRHDCARKIKGWLERAICRRLAVGWSPRQIRLRLILEGREYVSHETIYRYIWWNKQLGGTLYLGLRFKGRKRTYGKLERFGGRIDDRISYTERPIEAEAREEIGHWERDLIEGSGHSGSILTFIERSSRYLCLRKLESKKTEEVDLRSEEIISKYEAKFIDLTNDNGFEFGAHKRLSTKTGIQIYFTDPYSSWQRGSVENANGLVRSWLPKGTSFKDVDDDLLSRIEGTLNKRPRLVLGGRTPQEVFYNVTLKLFTQKEDLEIALRC